MNTINKEIEDKNAELREANADLGNLFTSSGIPTIFVDRDLNIRRYTSAATDVMRLIPADVGRSIEHVKERFRDGRLVADANAALQGESPAFEVRTEDGRWFLRRIVPYRLDDAINDITAQKEAFAASEADRAYAQTIIRTVRTPLIVLDAELRIVSTNSAFDDAFRNGLESLDGVPLDTIEDARWNPARLQPMLREVLGERKEVRELLGDGKDPSVEMHARAVMRRQLDQVRLLLDDLLDAGRIIAGKLQINRERVDLAEVAESAIESTAAAMEERGHRLSLSLPDRGEVLVAGDAGRLTEVVVNLLGNAAKYSDDGGRIELCIAADGDTATVGVRDTGIGMAAELMPRIFEVFTQGPRSLGRSERGLGLGLPLVQRIVELHGGEVLAFSDGEGKGSRFEIRLPRLADAPGSREAARSTNSRDGPSRRVLIVDDERDAAAMLGQVLQVNGHEFRVVHDGPAALKAAAEFKPDIVLLDLGLPGTDGYEVARRLREQGGTMRLMAVTGYRRDADRLRKAGFDDHLIKRVDLEQLWAKLV